MDDEVAHVRIVHRLLRRRFPGFVGLRIAGEDTHDMQVIQVADGDSVEFIEFTAENQMQQLFRRGVVGHVVAPVYCKS